MKQEINVAATFLASLLSRNSLQDHQDSLEFQSLQQVFSAALQRALYAKLLDHWHPSIPEQGQAYRAICINHKPGIFLLPSLALSLFSRAVSWFRTSSLQFPRHSCMPCGHQHKTHHLTI